MCHHFSACGTTLTSLTGVIQSPNFPNDYTNGLDCVYVISVPDTYRVTLTFTNFDVENSTDCSYDYVEVLNCWCCCNYGCRYFYWDNTVTFWVIRLFQAKNRLMLRQVSFPKCCGGGGAGDDGVVVVVIMVVLAWRFTWLDKMGKIGTRWMFATKRIRIIICVCASPVVLRYRTITLSICHFHWHSHTFLINSHQYWGCCSIHVLWHVINNMIIKISV